MIAYRDRLAITAQATTHDATGTTAVWVAAGSHWGLIAPISASARIAAGAMRGEVTHKVVMAGRVTVTFGRDRITGPSGRVFEPVEPATYPDPDCTVILVREVTDGGP